MSTVRSELLEGLLATIDRRTADAVALRGALHAEPELGGEEQGTVELLAAALEPLPVRRLASGGLMVRLGDGASPSVVLRAELDGLPIAELTGSADAARNGAMHACGHDVHMAALVSVTKAVAELPDGPPLPFVAIFQPSEERSPSGALALLEELAELRGARAVTAVHVHPDVPWGEVAVGAGAINASCDDFEIIVEGRGGHAAYPHLGADPVVALAAIVVALQTLVSRRSDPTAATVVSVGRLEADGSHNVIPSRARALGTLRTLRDEDRGRLREELGEIARAVALAHGCEARVEVEACEPVLVNDERLARLASAALPAAGLRAAARPLVSCGSDDFSYYRSWGPLLMQFAGVRGMQAVADVPLHDPRFLPRDEVVAAVAGCGAAIYAALAGEGERATSEEELP